MVLTVKIIYQRSVELEGSQEISRSLIKSIHGPFEDSLISREILLDVEYKSIAVQC